jgi:uncharacterized coiled-coil protein SlyX
MSTEKDKHIVLASEEVQRRNYQTIIESQKEHRKALIELKTMVDSFQSVFINQQKEINELRRQLGLLQQKFYAAGTTSYANNKN